MPPRRAAAVKAAAANSAAASKPAAKGKAKAKAPASKSKTTATKKGRKRAAPDDVEEEDEEADKDEETKEEEDDKPKTKKAKIDNEVGEKDKDDKADDEVKDDDEDKDAPAEDKEEVKKVEDKPPKMVSVVKRGNAVPVDPHSPYVSTHQVFVNSSGEIFDAMLNQTDIKKNSNKFYVLQLLQDVANNSNSVMFTRWGRVGEVGQTQVKGPFPPAQGEREFYKQYKSKTGSDWSVRKNMVPKAGKYTWIERDFSDDDDKKEDEAEGSGEANGDSKGKERAKTPECQAEARVQDLIKLIFNTQLMDAHLKELNYDANKLPLGKLAKSTILNGFSALKTLSDVIDNPTGDTAASYGGFQQACERLSGNYYSLIPHLFNRNQRPITINTKELLKRELDLVDALSDMTISSKIIQSSTNDSSGDPSILLILRSRA
ncbi:hypothetical protein FRC02_001308 [Tulasnella sp. 418]|nr:hypothetical protein FRC02_001308 [Tulasnella sp. 418]